MTEGIDRTTAARLAESEPEWLARRRLHAWGVYENTPMPTAQLEEWRYTDLARRLHLDRLRLPSAEALPDDPATWPELLKRTMSDDPDASGHLVLVDGCVVHTDIQPSLASRGVVLTSLRSAVEGHAELLKEHLATQGVPPEEGKLQALNAALWTDGVFLYVPRGVRLESPVRVTRWISEAGAAFFTRTLIVAEAASQLSYVDEVLSNDLDAPTLASTSVEVIARESAQVQYVAVQRLGRGAFYQSAQRTLAGKDATLDTLNVSLGATTTRVDLNARLLGSGAKSNMLGLYFGDRDQHFDHNTSQDHLAPAARSDLFYKGALDGGSSSVLPRDHPGGQEGPADGRIPDQPQPGALRWGSSGFAAEARDRSGRREMLTRRHRGAARRGGALLPDEPWHLSRSGGAASRVGFPGRGAAAPSARRSGRKGHPRYRRQAPHRSACLIG